MDITVLIVFLVEILVALGDGCSKRAYSVLREYYLDRAAPRLRGYP